MGKGDYHGGSTTVGPGSGWFTFKKPKPRKPSKFTELGNARAAEQKRARAEWDFKEAKSLVVAGDEIEEIAGRRRVKVRTEKSAAQKAASNHQLLSRLRKKAEKRRRLGIEED